MFGLIPLFFNLPVATEEKASPGRRAEPGKALNPRDHLSHLPDRSSLTARSAGCIPSLAFRNFELGQICCETNNSAFLWPPCTRVFVS